MRWLKRGTGPGSLTVSVSPVKVGAPVKEGTAMSTQADHFHCHCQNITHDPAGGDKDRDPADNWKCVKCGARFSRLEAYQREQELRVSTASTLSKVRTLASHLQAKLYTLADLILDRDDPGRLYETALGIQVRADGDRYAATMEATFHNPQASAIGYGATSVEAVGALLSQLARVDVEARKLWTAYQEWINTRATMLDERTIVCASDLGEAIDHGLDLEEPTHGGWVRPKDKHDELADVLRELVEVVQGHLDNGDRLDSFTLQPARRLLDVMDGKPDPGADWVDNLIAFIELEATYDHWTDNQRRVLRKAAKWVREGRRGELPQVKAKEGVTP